AEGPTRGVCPPRVGCAPIRRRDTMSRPHLTGRPHRSRTDASRMRTQLIHGASDCKRWDFTHHAEASAGHFHPQPFCYIAIATFKDADNPQIAPPGVANIVLMTVVPSQPAVLCAPGAWMQWQSRPAPKHRSRAARDAGTRFWDRVFCYRLCVTMLQGP